MTAEVVECFLSNCVFLERVSLLGAESGNLRVVGSSIALKHLELHSCYFESVEIHDANLVSLIYYGPKINLLLRNVSRLTEVSINYLPPVRMIEDFSQLFLCCSQLEVLKLDTTWLYEEDHTFLKLPNLTHLELEFAAEDNCSLLKLASFLEASPNLQKLVLEFNHSPRVVELRDYRGRTSDFKLVIYLVENALELEKIVIGPLKYPHLVMKREQREVDHARQQLQEKLPKRWRIGACSQNLKRISDEIGVKDMGRSRERGAQAGLGGMVWPRRFQSNLTACIVLTQERNEVTSILHLACVHWSTWLLQLLGAELAVKQGLVDRISELEDGILGRVVSRLPLKQAVATSVLSNDGATCGRILEP
ncbi:hypothetical protein GBA52_028366 [Prunus armeniaca]|nr:hypothetical protein GBA52_028366 [Prunus armeniaca]